jgi:hypothetical protein
VLTVCRDDHTLAQREPLFDEPDEFLADRGIVGVHMDGMVVRGGATHLNTG